MPHHDAGAHSGEVSSLRGEPDERKQSEKELGLKEAALASALSGLVISDMDGRINYANAAWLRMHGWSTMAEVVGTQPMAHVQDAAAAVAIVDCMKSRRNWIGELSCRRRDGSVFPAEFVGNVVTDSQGEPIAMLASFVDITERKARETEIERLNRIYLATNHVNQALLHQHSRSGLFDEICRVLVEIGRFKMAFVGWQEPASQLLVPVAVAGDERDYVAGLQISADPSAPSSRGPTGTALREERTYVCNDFFSDPATVPWREAAARSGIQSSIALPLRLESKTAGVLTVYAAEKDFFQPLEVSLLQQAADEISFGLEVLTTEARRKEAEDKARQSHNLLTNLAQLVPGVIYQYRLFPDGRSAFPYASPGMNDIYEVTPEEAREDATSVFGRLHPDDYERVGTAIQESARTLQTFYCEFRVILPRQGLRWRWSQAQPMRTEDGGTLWHGIISDITERKKAEAALATTAELLERTGAIAKIGGWELDLRTMELFWSLETCRIHEVDPPLAPALDRAIDFYAPEDRPIIRAAVQAAIDYGTPYDLELQLITAQGRSIWVRAQCSPGMEDGKVTKLFGAFHDITERKRAEETFNKFFEQPMALNLIAMPDGVIHRVNGSFEDLLGYGRGQLAGVNFLELVHPDDQAATIAEMGKLAQGINTFYFENRYRQKNGEFRFLAWSSSVSTTDQMIFAVATDITERKRAEAAIQSSINEKEALLKEVHHRVKNNLQVITSLLRMEARRSEYPPTKSVLKEMQGRIMSMALLHESLYRTGTFAAVDLGAYLKELATQSFRTSVVQLGAVRLQLDLASVPVEMDQALPCGLIVNELISNSIKHGFPGKRTGEVRVELHPVDGGPQLRLRVSDTGVGLPADFETKRGKSLGLQLVSDMAKQIDGRLEVGPGPGAIFDVIFTPKHSKPSPSTSTR